MKLSAVLIVKNEHDHIKDVLTSLSGVDEIIVCDTGSTDDTVDLARLFTDKVYTDYVWADDFAGARNHALAKATGDWVLSIDGDEVLQAGGVERIRNIIANASEDQLQFSVEMTSKGSGQKHNLPRFFRNDGSVKWLGAAHETLSPVQRNLTDVVIVYGYSSAHALDPDRMLRILAKQVASPEGTPRDLYYYAREYWYRKDYVNAVRLFEEYVTIATWLPEKADAYLYIARGHWILQNRDKAVAACTEAIVLNPQFKEALLFMSELFYEPWKHKWEQLAENATNEDVLFKRI